MDDWGFEQLRPWLSHRSELPLGPLFCVIEGPTRGGRWDAGSVRIKLRALALEAGVRRRFAPHHYADLRIMPTSSADSALQAMIAA